MLALCLTVDCNGHRDHYNKRLYDKSQDQIPILFMYVCMYVCMAAMGLRCCIRAFSSCGERGLLFVAVRGLLIAVASLVVEHGL